MAQKATDETSLSYFLPEGEFSYNRDIPQPADILGFNLGEQHAEWNQVVEYMKALAKSSDRVTVKETGRTYQHRPFLEVVITSPDNQKRIESIRTEHLKLADTRQSASTDISKMPSIVSLIYSIHGNEPSGVNGSLAVAYFFAAAQDAKVDDILSHTVIILSPGLNPDGINRFASWVNSSRSLNTSDPNSREFDEPWPSSRTNHFWADCNRDWLMAQHPEGITALQTYLDWLPNVVADHHEQGPSRNYYFSPGHPKRTHQLTSQLNQDLTAEVSAFCAKELNKIGSMYFSKEGYDDFYYGKGAAYGDIHGSVCLLYEQATSRGHIRETRHGIRSFAWTIRNQAYASYATVMAGYEMRERLLAYQKQFYEKTKADATKLAVKGYVFDTRGSKGVAYHFLENMAHHQIEIYQLAKDVSANQETFKAGDAYLIPMDQKFHTAIRAIMENNRTYEDSSFYDISTWTFPHAFNLRYAELKSVAGLVGEKVVRNDFPKGQIIGGRSNYGYVFECSEFYAHKVIYELLKKGIRMGAGTRPFLFRSGNTEKQMGYGTIVIPVQNQTVSSDEIYALLNRLSTETGVDVYAASTGLMDEVDLGSPSFTVLKQPKVALLVGRTMSVPESGEIWYLLDRRFQMQPTLIETTVLTSVMLQRYTVIIMANGVPALTKESETALKEWVSNGGTLIATGKASTWVNRTGLISIKTASSPFKEDSTLYRPYYELKDADAGHEVSGVILNCALDKSHPIGWGANQTEIAVIKTGNIFFKKDANPFVSPLHYTSKPLLSGFLSAQNEQLLKDTPAAFAKAVGNGAVIVFADDLLFRSYYFGTTKLFMNAIFFNECIKTENYYY
ncbi:peptidase M14 [Bacteroidia bacterium]|nr:peptidase M14 [Bacteroidia bacterium]